MDHRIKATRVMIKIALLGGLCLLIISGIIWSSLFQVKDGVLTERKASIRHSVEMALSVTQSLYDQQQAGLLSEQEAVSRARNALRAMTYGEGGYMFVITTDKRMLIHGKIPELENRFIKDLDTKNDIEIATTQLKTAFDGGGFFSYKFRKVKQDSTPYSKIAYVKMFEPWHWAIASGLYIDDIDDAYVAQIYRWGKIIIWPMLLLFLVGGYLARTISGPIAELESAKLMAEQAAQAKSDFLANMSHEIRTPINSILGFSRLVTESDASTEVCGWGNIIYHAGENLLRIINDILDLTKIDAGRMTIVPAPFDLCKAVSEVTDLQLLTCREKNIEVNVHFDASVPSCCIGDIGRIKQIITNLINNAVKFTDSGYVLVSLRARFVGDTNFVLMCTIKDSGIGIPADKARYIFEKFSQVEESSRRKFGGTGLGLAITRSLAELMGGKIKLLHSEEKKGSSFVVLLPMQKAKEEIQYIKAPSDIHLTGCSALIIDNFEISCEIARRFLEKQGIVCTEAQSLAVAREKLAEVEGRLTPYDFIILDYKMEDGHALTFSHSVKDNPFFAATQIIMVTAFGQFSNIDRLAVNGINAYLVKPFYPAQFETILKLLWRARLKDEKLPVLTLHTLTSLLNMPQGNVQRGIKRAFGLKILVAEDMPMNQLLMTKVLDNLGCTVTTAGNGLEAVRCLTEFSYDLVFMDCHMPEMDGYEATGKIRQLETPLGKYTPIIALTADAMIGDRERCLVAGMDDYLYKPFKPEQIIIMLEKWVMKKAVVDEVTPLG